MFGNWFLESLIDFSKNPREMFIVECYIFIGNIAKDRDKRFIKCNYYEIWLLTFFWLNENWKLYFRTYWPFHTLIIGTIEKQLSSCLADFVVKQNLPYHPPPLPILNGQYQDENQNQMKNRCK